MDLNTIWFGLVGVLIIGYAILDGFDLGVGVLHLFTKDEKEKRININAVGPVWDGNEVWLLTGGGALFAAFPIVYATVFSAFYLALMLLLTALIFRAVSFEFRNKVDSPKWRSLWDWSFGIGSLLPSVLFGVAYGNILRGIPLNEIGVFTGSFFTLLNPYSILIGLVSLSLFTMHGAIYLTMKTEGEYQEKIISFVPRLWFTFIVLYVLGTIASLFVSPFLFVGIMHNPLFWLLFVIFFVSVLGILPALKRKKYFMSFLSSSLSIASIIGLTAVSLFPALVPSLTNLQYSLTIYNASSSEKTLTIMLIIALIGMPIVISYTILIYRIFKGKVELNEHSY
jgi:cytochrome bd ubiquinol oxidase subunit II